MTVSITAGANIADNLQRFRSTAKTRSQSDTLFSTGAAEKLG